MPIGEESILNQYLNQFKVSKGSEFTHTTLGKYPTSYNVPKEENNKFIKKIHEAIFEK